MNRYKIFYLIASYLFAIQCYAQPAADMHIPKYYDNKTPYSLYGGIFGSSPTYDQTAVKLLAENFDAFYGNFNITLSTANALRAINPNFDLIKYQGAWQLAGASRIKVENEKDQVLHYRVANLNSAISATQTKFLLTDIFGKLLPSDSELSASVGIFQSTFFKYVTWIRVGNEVMKLINVTNNEVEVLRGFDGTVALSYPAGTPVLSPVYGTPPSVGMRTEVTYRNDEATTLRWDNLLVSLDAEYIKNRGGIWIDIVVGNLSQFAQSGESVPSNRIWDIKNNGVYNANFRAQKSEEGIKYMQDRFRQKYSIWPVIWGNNMLFPSSITDSRVKLLLSTDIKPRPLDGFAQENAYAGYGTGGNSGKDFSWAGYPEWRNNLKSIIFMGEQKILAKPLIMDGGADNATFALLPAERRHKLFMYSYASYLLGVKVESNNEIYTSLGFTPIVNTNGRITFELDPCFTWDIGKPAETRTSQDFEQYKINGKDIWIRRFEKGIVVVNPTDLDINDIDLTSYNSSFYNPDNNQSDIKTINLEEHSGAILLYNKLSSITDEGGQIAIYPSPAKESITVKLLDAGNYTIDLYTATGSLVFTKQQTVNDKNESLSIDIRELPASSYFIHIKSESNKQLNIKRRIIKE